jgi:hypothetical protein
MFMAAGLPYNHSLPVPVEEHDLSVQIMSVAYIFNARITELCTLLQKPDPLKIFEKSTIYKHNI